MAGMLRKYDSDRLIRHITVGPLSTWPILVDISRSQSENWVKKIQAAAYNGARTVLNGNHCILRIRGAPVHRKLGLILENKVVQKLKLEKKMFFTKKMVS